MPSHVYRRLAPQRQLFIDDGDLADADADVLTTSEEKSNMDEQAHMIYRKYNDFDVGSSATINIVPPSRPPPRLHTITAWGAEEKSFCGDANEKVIVSLPSSPSSASSAPLSSSLNKEVYIKKSVKVKFSVDEFETWTSKEPKFKQIIFEAFSTRPV